MTPKITTQGVLLAILCVFLLHAGNADAKTWVCNCGCEDPTCINMNGECYVDNGVQNFNDRANGSRYLDVDNKFGTIVHTDNGIIVDGTKKNQSWGYYFKIPVKSRHYLHWKANLEVVKIAGPNWAGLTVENENIGITFSVNRYGRGRIVLKRVNVTSETIESFKLSKEFRETVKDNFHLNLRYDIETSTLSALIDDTPIKTIVLPYYGIPAIASVSGFSIQTANNPLQTLGTVTYGDFQVEGSNRARVRASCK